MIPSKFSSRGHQLNWHGFYYFKSNGKKACPYALVTAQNPKVSIKSLIILATTTSKDC